MALAVRCRLSSSRSRPRPRPRPRLETFGYAPDIAGGNRGLSRPVDRSAAVRRRDRRSARRGRGSRPGSFRSTNFPRALRELAPRRDETHGLGADRRRAVLSRLAVPALARLEGFARFGSPATGGPPLPGQVRQSCARLRRRSRGPADAARWRESEEIAALGDWPAARGRCSSSPTRSGRRSAFSLTAFARPSRGCRPARDASGAAIGIGR